MAKVLFLGAEPQHFAGGGWGSVGTSTLNTSGTGFDRTPFIRTNLMVSPVGRAGWAANHLTAPFEESASEFWATFRCWSSDLFDGVDWLTHMPFAAFMSGSTKIFGISHDDVGRMYLLQDFPGDTTTSSHTATGWQTFTPATLPNAFVNMYKIDVYCRLNGSSSVIRVYNEGVKVIDWTGTLSATSADNLILSAVQFNSADFQTFFTEVAVARFDTRNCAVCSHWPQAAGIKSDWQGTFADVNRADYRNSATALTTSGTYATSLFPVRDLPTGNFSVRAVQVSAVATRGLSGAPDLNLALHNGTQLSLSDTMPVEGGPTFLHQIWETSPYSGDTWTTTEVNNLSIGVRSGIAPPVDAAETVSATSGGSSNAS